MHRSVLLYCITFLLLLHNALWRQNRVQVGAQDIPTIECPNNFGYLRYADEFIARITVPNITHGTTHLDVQLTQRQPVLTNYYGKLSLFEDRESTLNNIKNGRPVSYRLDFPIPNMLPKLQRISVNGDVICASSDPPLNIVFNLQHNLNTPVQPFSAVSTESTSTPPPSKFNDAITPPPNRKTPRFYQSINNFALQPKKYITKCSISSVKRANETTSSTVKRKLVNRGEYPWLVAVYKKEAQTRKYLCTGSLVSMRSIITVANCFKFTAASQIVVHLGQYDLKEIFEDDVVERTIENVIIHPDFNITEKPDADVAILQMSKPVTYTEYISPICLWNEPEELSRIIGQMGSIVGWHVLEDSSRDDDEDLEGLPKLVKGGVASNEDCLRSNPIYSHLISAHTICAGNLDGSGPCLGDSGAGFMLNRDGVWGRCSLHDYVVYTDLAKHSAWIDRNLI